MAWPLGWLSDRVDRRLVISAASTTAATMLIGMLVVVPHGAYEWVLYLCAALFGATVVPSYSIIIAQVSDVVAKDELVAASGGLLLLNGIGATVGPIVAGFTMSATPRALTLHTHCRTSIDRPLGRVRPVGTHAPRGNI